MRTITLVNGGETFVDDDWYDYLSQWPWKHNKQDYVYRIGEQRTLILMHRVVNETPKGFDTDHIDTNTYNNQKKNLQTLTPLQHTFKHGRRAQSGYKGVYWNKRTSKFQVQIWTYGKGKYLGSFTELEKAKDVLNEYLSTKE